MNEIRKWLDILRALPYDGGPSSTRWVVLNVALVTSLASLLLSCCIAWVYVRSSDHHFDAALGLMVSGTFSVMFGFAANLLKAKNALSSDGGKADDNPS